MSDDWSGRELHFIAIGGAGMSGLALVCHRLGAAVTGCDRAESSYLERLRAAGHRAARSATTPTPCPRAPRSSSRPRSPRTTRSSRRARERGQRVIHRGELLAELCAEKRLIAVAGTHGKTTTAGMLVHALRALGADPAFFLGGELPGRRRRTAAARTPAGATGEWVVAEADESDASFLELRARGRRGHQRRARPPLALGLARRAARAPSRAFAAPARGPGAARRRRASTGSPRAAAGSLRFDAERPGPGARPARSRVATTCSTRARRSPRSSSPASTLERGRRGARPLPRDAAPPASARAAATGAAIYDDYAHHPTEVARDARGAARARAAAADRRLPAAPLLAHQGARRALRRGAGRRRRGRRARRLPGARGAGRASSPGSAASTSPGRPPTAPAGGRSGGCADADTRRAGARRRGSATGDLLVTIGAGDVFTARRGAGRTERAG